MGEVLIAVNEVKEIVLANEGQTTEVLAKLDEVNTNLETLVMTSDEILEESITINEHLEQIDATLKIFFVGACIIVFAKLFINTFFKGW